MSATSILALSALYVPLMTQDSMSSVQQVINAVERAKGDNKGAYPAMQITEISKEENAISLQMGGINNIPDLDGWTYYCEKQYYGNVGSVRLRVIPETLEMVESLETIRNKIAYTFPFLKIDTTPSSLKIAARIKEEMKTRNEGVWTPDFENNRSEVYLFNITSTCN